MKRSGKNGILTRALALVMTVMMFVSLMPVQAFAGEEPVIKVTGIKDTALEGASVHIGCDGTVTCQTDKDGCIAYNPSIAEWLENASGTSPVIISVMKDGYVEYSVTVTEGITSLPYEIKMIAKQAELTWEKPSETVGYVKGMTYTNTVTGGSGDGEVTYKIKAQEPKNVATDIDKTTGKLTINDKGTKGIVTVMATKAATDDYAEATAEYTLTLKAAQNEFKWVTSDETERTVVWTDVMEYTETAAGGTGDGEITYKIKSQKPEDAATIDESGKLTINKPGVITVVATKKAESEEYADATIKYTLTAKKEQSELVWEKDENSRTVAWNEEYTNAIAIGGDSEGAVTYSVKSQEPADTVKSIDKDTGKLTFNKPGSVTVEAIKAADDTYFEATAEYGLTVTKAVLSLSFAENNIAITTGLTYSGQKVNVSEAVAYSSDNTDVATVDKTSGAVTVGLVPGTATITAKADADYYCDANGNEASASYTITIRDLDLTEGLPFEVTSGEKSAIGYYTGTVKVKARKDYVLSVDNKASWSSDEKELTVSEGQDVNNVKFYTKEKETDDSTAVEHTLNELFPYTVSGTLGNNGWYVSDVTIARKDNYTLSNDKKTWVDNYTVAKDTEGTDVQFYAKNKDGLITSQYTVNIKRDTTAPDGEEISISIVEKKKSDGGVISTIIKWLDVTFLGGNYDQALTISAEGSDTTSGVDKIEYCIEYNQKTPYSTEKQITDNIEDSKWIIYKEYKEEVEKEEGEKEEGEKEKGEKEKVIIEDQEGKPFIVYVRVTDKAGNVTYKNSQGIIINNTAPTVSASVDENQTVTIWKLNEETADEKVYYGSNVVIAVEANDNPNAEGNVVGLQSVTYKVVKAKDSADEKVIQSGSLFDYSKYQVEDVSTDNIIHSFKSGVAEVNPNPDNEDIKISSYPYIVVDTSIDENTGKPKADGDDITVIVTATDNAGNISDTEIPLKITTVEPTFTVTYDEQEPSLKGTDYYTKTRTAKIEITGRRSLFPDDMNQFISVEAKNSKGDAVNTYKVEWDIPKTGNDVTATATVTFNSGANYTLKANYADILGRVATYPTGEYVEEKEVRGTNFEDPFTVDGDKPEVEVILPKANENEFYNSDIIVKVNALDSASGIKNVTYKVVKDGKTTQNEKLYQYKYNNIEDAICSEWSNDKEIEVTASDNNSDNVNVLVTVTDNAGNKNTVNVPVKINCTAPVVTISYDNNNAVQTLAGRGYYTDARTAKIVITDRTSTFDPDAATSGIIIKAADSEGNTVENAYEISSWTTEEGENPDDATHTATVTFNKDANYDITVQYKNKADLENKTEEGKYKLLEEQGTANPICFAIDSVEPEVEVEVFGANIKGENQTTTWSEYIKELVWNVWHKNQAKITISAKDATSKFDSTLDPVEDEIQYFKDNTCTIYTVEELEAHLADNENSDSWTRYEESIIYQANQQFIIYIKATDYAGNVKYISTNGVIVDDVETAIKIDKLNEPGTGFYTGDAKVKISINERSEGNTYSGIGEVRVEVLNGEQVTQDEILYKFGSSIKEGWTLDKNETSGLTYNLTGEYTVLSSLNDSNKVTVKVTVYDNAGNMKIENETSLKIDASAPSISIKYDNNTADNTLDGNYYFNNTREATITIIERNFTEGNVNVNITNTDGTVPAVSRWLNNGSTHIATVTYSADGDYTFGISCTDDAGNSTQGARYENGTVAPTKFTIDKTAPVITVEYDNNDALNDNYYKATRTAVIMIKEHNFETSRINITMTAVDDGKTITLPVVGTWATNGDSHAAQIEYKADAKYTFDIEYSDKAGNAAADYTKDEFYIDLTMPAVKLEGIKDESANPDKGSIGFVLTATDTNFDVFKPELKATLYDGEKFTVKTISTGKITDVDHGQTFTIENIEDDGIYTLTATITDKAGNDFTEVYMLDSKDKEYAKSVGKDEDIATFTVNRTGSVFYLDDNTTELVNQFYVQNVVNDVVVFEINADDLQSYGVTVNGKEIEEGADGFTFKKEKSDWYHFTYTINKALFAEEGEYNVVVYSKDKANNNAFSDVKSAKVNFVVDRTAPVVAVTGMKTGGRYRVTEQTVSLIPTDDGGALASILVRSVDKKGNPIQTLIDLSGEELEKALEEGNGVLTFAIGKGLYQNFEIICKDQAVDESGNVNTCDDVYEDVSVSTSRFMMFWANRPLRWGTIAGIVVIGGAVYIFLKKKKEKKDKK